MISVFTGLDPERLAGINSFQLYCRQGFRINAKMNFLFSHQYITLIHLHILHCKLYDLAAVSFCNGIGCDPSSLSELT
jgi:hypothetical protein